MEGTESVDRRIEALADWRGSMLALVRRLIHEADPLIVEEAKWATPSNLAGVPVWSHGGIICTGEAYHDEVKLTFVHGALLPDPHQLFNANLKGPMRRAIRIRKGETLNVEAFKELVRTAVAANLR